MRLFFLLWSADRLLIVNSLLRLLILYYCCIFRIFWDIFSHNFGSNSKVIFSFFLLVEPFLTLPPPPAPLILNFYI